MPTAVKQELVQLLARREIPLLEDDAYADLQFASTPGVSAKAFDERGLVMHWGSFSKCLAPGYCLGWVAAGCFSAEPNRFKVESSLATKIHHGGFNSHFMALRQALESQQAAALQSLQQHFPDGYRVGRPTGGYF